MTTDTLDLPPIVAHVTEVLDAAPAKVTVRDAALQPLNALAPGLRAVTERYRAVAFDLKTPKGLQAAKDARHDLRKNGRFLVQNTRDELKELLNDAKTAVESKATELIAITRPREDELHKDIEAREAEVKAEKAEAARILAERQQKQADGVAGIRAYLSHAQTTADMTAERVGNGIKMLEGMTFSADNWLDPVAAANAQCETLEGLRTLQATLKAHEEAAAAAEAQRLENERVAAELAEQKRQADAEQARIAGIMARIAEIRAAATGHERATAADLYEARIAVAALDTSETVYGEYATLANATQLATMAALDKFHAEATTREERAEVERVLSIPLPLTIPEESTEGQDSQKVLKAEGESPDATDRATPADTSPRVGAMGAGQAADAAPAAELLLQDECRGLSKALAADPAAPLHAREDADAITHGAVHVAPNGDQSRITLVVSAPLPEPTMTLGEFNTYIAPLRIDGAGLESLGFPAAGRRKAAMLYHDTDKAAMVAAMVKHLQSL